MPHCKSAPQGKKNEQGTIPQGVSQGKNALQGKKSQSVSQDKKASRKVKKLDGEAVYD
jgi:hypothetical protein